MISVTRATFRTETGDVPVETSDFIAGEEQSGQPQAHYTALVAWSFRAPPQGTDFFHASRLAGIKTGRFLLSAIHRALRWFKTGKRGD
jgi:hypothetical protein